MTLAKALANGVPIGAMLTREDIASVLVAGTHGSTFGGTPFITSVALATLTTILDGKLWERAARRGRHLLDAARTNQATDPACRYVLGGTYPARRARGAPGRPRDRPGDARIGPRRRAQPVAVGRRDHGSRLFPLDDHRARSARLGPRDQRPVGSRAPVPGAGRLLHLVGARRRLRHCADRVDR